MRFVNLLKWDNQKPICIRKKKLHLKRKCCTTEYFPMTGQTLGRRNLPAGVCVPFFYVGVGLMEVLIIQKWTNFSDPQKFSKIKLSVSSCESQLYNLVWTWFHLQLYIALAAAGLNSHLLVFRLRQWSKKRIWTVTALSTTQSFLSWSGRHYPKWGESKGKQVQLYYFLNGKK